MSVMLGTFRSFREQFEIGSKYLRHPKLIHIIADVRQTENKGVGAYGGNAKVLNKCTLYANTATEHALKI